MGEFFSQLLMIISFVIPVVLIVWALYRFLFLDMLKEMDGE